jgi:signal transduction histidine kinase
VDSESTSWLGRALNLVGIVAVAYSLFAIAGTPLLAMVAGCLSLAGWLALVLLPRHPSIAQTLALAIMVVAGGISTVPASGLLVVPVAVAVLRTVSALSRPLWQGIVVAIAGVLFVAVGAILAPVPPLGFISIEGGVVIAALAGISRRQFRAADAQSRVMVEEQARATVLAGRQTVARDIHDVLAHSLGGLIVQLDAIDALLEVGRVADAATRVRDARSLAVSGLSEARRAVGALRDAGPDEISGETDAPIDVMTALTDLLDAHRALGGTARADAWGEQHALAPAAAVALTRMLQEALTNARKHAPGATVMVLTVWEPDGVRFVVSNDLVDDASAAAASGGYGLAGMAERFAALPDSEFSAAARDGGFVVEARVGRR